MKFAKHKLLRDAQNGLLIVVAALTVGLVLNLLRKDPLPLKYENKSARLDAAVVRLSGKILEADQLGETITADDMEALLRQKTNVVILDVRPDLFYEDSHIPGAVNLSREDFEKNYPMISSRLAQAERVIVYCAGDHCEEAEMVAKALRKLGHQKLSIYPGGWAEWQRQRREYSSGKCP